MDTTGKQQLLYPQGPADHTRLVLGPGSWKGRSGQWDSLLTEGGRLLGPRADITMVLLTSGFHSLG